MKCRKQRASMVRGITPACVLLLAAISGSAQTTNSPAASETPLTLSLAQAQQIAFERNWDLLAAAAGVDAASAQKIVAREFPNPTLSMSTFKINVDEHPSSTSMGNGLWERSYDTIFAINQLFEVGGKRSSRKASAQAGFEAARAQFLDAKRTLDLGLAKAYSTAVQVEENVRVLKQSASLLREEARIAEVRFKAGEISDSDKKQIEIAADRLELDAQVAVSAAAQARVAIEVLLGNPHPNGAVVLTDDLDRLSASAVRPATQAQYLWRPDVAAAEAALRKSEADLRLQKANRIPDPTALAQYEHEPPDTPNTIGLGVSFPLPLWNHNRGNILAAQAAREQARLAYEKTSAQAAAELATARLAYEEALRRWERYRDEIRPKSEQIRKTVAYAYEKGGASLLDLLSTQRNDNDVRLAVAQAENDVIITSAALKAATTQITPAQLKR